MLKTLSPNLRNPHSQIRNGIPVSNEQAERMKQRTRSFALDVVRYCETLPRSRALDVLTRQLLRSATSVAANYRAACRARSKAEFVAKLGIVEEEADESQFWLEMIQELHSGQGELSALIQESCEIVAITVSSIRTAKR